MRPVTAHDAGQWPVRHMVQLVLLVLVLQPVVLLLLFVDVAPANGTAPTSWVHTALAHLTRLVRAGSSEARADGAARAWSMTLALKGAVMMQAWYCTRMHAWYTLAEGYERREKPSELRARQRTASQQIEALALSALSLPLLWLLALVMVVLVGAPVNAQLTGTLTLAAYLALFGLWPLTHMLGTPPSALWLRILTAPSTMLPRELIVLLPCVGAWLGALVGALPQALDWGRAWQAWPVPSVYGAVAGVVLGHLCRAGGTRGAPVVL
ncbi:Glycosylphosphatidylinositol (GPI) anchor assembly protein [Malassezia caprae]|uniref:Glycosylphosphatidylinositol (GPI) anchor assembly protein n=1 Tax=Malassezia caprae TaxID=1381934 RepID=A0AAF0E626_9BASI|nr:Glycosylphosphatidylinositol (GPI) anchor assembly protein [Malassezia caprae]